MIVSVVCVVMTSTECMELRSLPKAAGKSYSGTGSGDYFQYSSRPGQ